ncbi:MAG TPA: sodium:solute symporter family protein [Firmicutes bacterium]|jgi:SSS family solute:Na+ symporter|nr:sodium:solute symporter family protein [Bacillota bacterium]
MLRWDILTGVLVYIIGLSIIIGIFVLRKGLGKSGDSYLYGDKKLSPWLAGVTMGVSAIGALHCAGYMESAATFGILTFWYTVPTGFYFIILGCFLAAVYRKMGFNTIQEIFANIYDLKTRVMTSIIGMVFCFALLSLETQGGAIITAIVTGIDVHTALIFFMICALIYLLISGMWQVTYLNIVNTILMYAAVVAAFIIVTLKLPAGWAGVDAFYNSQGLSDFLSFWPKDLNLILGFALAITIGQTLTVLTDQGVVQYILATKDTTSAKKSSFIALLVNTPFAFFTIAFGLAAWTIPQFAAEGPKMAGMTMLLTYLPTFVVILVLAAFLIAVLSTWARCTMGISQIIVNDLYLVLSKSPNKHKAVPFLSRLLIVVVGAAAIIPAFYLPHMLLAGLFIFALGIPLVVMMVIGLYWKRNSNVAFYTMIVSLVACFVWEYTGLPAALGAPEWFGATYLSLVITLVLGVGLNLLIPGEKGFLVRETKTATINM